MDSEELEGVIDDIICGEVEMSRWESGISIKPINGSVISVGEIDLIIEVLRKHGWEYYISEVGFQLYKP